MTDVPALSDSRPTTMESSSLSIALGQYSTAGRKAENQDFHGALQAHGPELVTKGIAIALADGISTSTRGGEAAAIAVKTFLDDYYATSEGLGVRRSGELVISATNGWMHAHNSLNRPREEGADREKAGLICTFSALVAKGRMGHIFHIGDARIARFAEGAFETLTGIHRVSLGSGKSYLGRALGADARVEIEYRQLPLRVGDTFILSTDGVHEFVDDAAICALLASEDDLPTAARMMAELAMANGSDDNLTVQLVRVESLPSGDIEDLLGADLELPMPPEFKSGNRLDGYELLERLHSGSRSHVWLARDLADDASVVIKALSTELAQDEGARASLMLEEWVMRRLSHPGLLGAPPMREARRTLYSVSKFVPGISLSKWIEANPRPPLAQVRKILNQVSAALETMHRRGMLHRDLRPQNILVDGAGKATIIDFGSTQVEGLDEAIPRGVEDAAFAGTMQFSAPELYLGYPASVASDVYSLGAIAYHMLTGGLPYGPRVAAANTSRAQKSLRYQSASAFNPDLPDWVDAALANAVSIDPHKRCATPAEFITNLAQPDPVLLRNHAHPLLERGSARSWRIVAAVLAAALAIAILTRPDVMPDNSPATEQEMHP